MLNFKKTLRTVLLFFVILGVVSIAPITCFLLGENHLFQDIRERNELAGSIDYLLVGASHLERGLIPAMLDEGLGVNSYNLSYNSITVKGRLELLKMETERNPVKTLILDVSMNTMSLDPDTEALEGDLFMVSRLRTLRDGFHYLLTTIPPWHYGWVYYHFMDWGLDDIKRLLTDQYRIRNQNQKKGYVPHKDETELLGKKSLKRLKKMFHTHTRKDTILPENDAYLRDIFTYCQEHDLNLILVSMPVSEFLHARYDNLDVTYTYFRDIAAEYGFPFYDFNLLRDEDKLLSDATDFTDKDHLSNPGAVKFTTRYIEIMKKLEAGEDISSEFFENYAEMYEHRDYAK